MSALAVGKKDLTRLDLERIALRALEGIGNAQLGEWRELTDKAFHIRRRLRPTEEMLVGPAIDLRSSWEGIERFEQMKPFIPAFFYEQARAELVS